MKADDFRKRNGQTGLLTAVKTFLFRKIDDKIVKLKKKL